MMIDGFEISMGAVLEIGMDASEQSALAGNEES
jgi:hypothetical protein